MPLMPLNLLIVEDSEDDAHLLVRTLKRGGFNVRSKRVDKAEDLSSMLEKGPWDMAITDHQMPNFDSGRAIKIVKSRDPDMPVIIVSGSIGEEFAVNSMRDGANDYIMKSNMARLVPAVIRELREVEARRDRLRIEKALHHVMHYDELTGLTNRTEFELRLRRSVDIAREENRHHALLYLDLDQFKIVNDTCGHAAGDSLLRQLAPVLQKPIRSRDTLARVGGDEFCILLENCSDKKAINIAYQIRKLVESFSFTWEKKRIGLSVSIGMVFVTPESKSAEELLSAVDLACQSAKEQGRNCLQVYHADEDKLLQRKTEMMWAMRLDAAILGNRFVLYRQMIKPVNKDNNNNQAPHYEILLRMLDTDGKIILPGEFIPAAEKYGRMRGIDRWTIKNACKAISLCRGGEQGVYAINISGDSFGDESLYGFVTQQIEKYSLNASQICFEVTETAAIINFHNALDFIKRIRGMGCKISLDDFGSGLSSFSYLKMMELDYLKIDGSFVKGIVESKMDRAIVKSINQIGHAAGIKTIAEYVENMEIYNCLRDIGVDYVQGYGIDKPELF